MCFSPLAQHWYAGTVAQKVTMSYLPVVFNGVRQAVRRPVLCIENPTARYTG